MDIGQLLASFGEADHLAVSAVRWLSVSPLLTDAEQTMYGEVIARQERQHAEVSYAWAKKYGWTLDQGLLPAITLAQRDVLIVSHLPEPMRTIQTLGAIRASEAYGVEWLGILTDQFGEVAELREMVNDYCQVMRDEQLHVDTSSAIVARLGADPKFRKQEQLAYERARVIYGPLIVTWPDLSQLNLGEPECTATTSRGMSETSSAS